MNEVQINNIVIANNDDKGTGVTLRQINFEATFSDSTHLSGFVMITEGDFQQMSYSDLKAEVKKRVVENLESKLVEGN